MGERVLAGVGALFMLGVGWEVNTQQATAPLKKIELPANGLALERQTHPGAFFDLAGRRAGVFGYEHRGVEAWAYPLQIVDDFRLAFNLEGYPLSVPAEDLLATIAVRPEATVFTYSHAAFTVRQILFVPIDEPAVVMLLDVRTTLPMRITGSFRPRLKLMWPAGLMTPYVSWNDEEDVYVVSEESRKFAAAIAVPGGRDLSLMPYQEEPRDVPVTFAVDTTIDQTDTRFIPIVIAGSVNGTDDARAACRRVLAAALDLYRTNVTHYRAVSERTTRVRTPDESLNSAYEWSKIGIDKGIVTNPFLGTGLVAGYRTAGESERPGFAWFFGRDSMWTALASASIGDFDTVRTALRFLEKYQRADGKIPHEISQSASLIPWFSDYPYAWASADATPLYVIAHVDYWRASGDLEFLQASWPSILKAYRFSAGTDSDGNALIENTGVGHGWVEGGALYPAHEEIYMQGLWIETLRGIAELADVMKDAELATTARATAERVRYSVERTYWLADRNFYAFATAQPRKTPAVAEPGPRRGLRQKRLDALAGATLIDEDTVLPAVPLWWRTLNDDRAQHAIDRIGSGALATDWGTRLLSARSDLYDPLSYHYGSVWPLFTGWAAMAAYQYGRPHVGFQAVTSNAQLTYAGALGYVTELLSGDFNAAFGRSSHHQIWSEAMVATPLIRGLLGVSIEKAGTMLRFAPQLPVNWNRVAVENVRAGAGRYDLRLERTPAGQMTITLDGRSGSAQGQASPLQELVVVPAFPLDATIESVTVNGRSARFDLTRRGDVQQARVAVEAPTTHTTIAFRYAVGTDVYVEPQPPAPGAANTGLRVLRSTAERKQLRLVLEGRGGQRYKLLVRTPHRLATVAGVAVKQPQNEDAELEIEFAGNRGEYVRREVLLPLLSR